MAGLPALVTSLLRWAALFSAILLATVVYYHVAVLGGDSGADALTRCNFSTSSDDVCAEAQQHNRIYEAPWTGGYSVLTPGHGYYNEALRNPALTDALTPHPTPDCPSARRYVLESVQTDRRYFVRLCFKGAPSVQYHIRLLHVRRSSLHDAASTDHLSRVRRVAEPLVTDVITVSMQCATGDGSALFHRKEAAWCEAVDLRKGLPEASTGADASDPFLPVMEVTATISAVTPYPELFPCLFYDLHLDGSLLNATPPHVLTAVLPFILFALTLTLCLPWLMRRMQDPASVPRNGHVAECQQALPHTAKDE